MWDTKTCKVCDIFDIESSFKMSHLDCERAKEINQSNS